MNGDSLVPLEYAAMSESSVAHSADPDEVRPPHRVVVATEIRLYREGLAQALAAWTSIEVAGTVAQSEDLLARVMELAPHVLLLDIGMPGSLAFAREAARTAPDTRVLALAVAEATEDVLACAEAGIAGYVPRDASLGELVAAIDRATRGELLCSPRIASYLFHRVGTSATGGAAEMATPLTAREVEIVRLIEQGLSNKQIARRLQIELATVKNHVHNILNKLNLSRRGEAAAWIRAHPRSTDLPLPLSPV